MNEKLQGSILKGHLSASDKTLFVVRGRVADGVLTFESSKSKLATDPRLYKGDPTLPAILGHHTGGPHYEFKAPRQVK